SRRRRNDRFRALAFQRLHQQKRATDAYNALPRRSCCDGRRSRGKRPLHARVARTLVLLGARRHHHRAFQPALHSRHRTDLPVRGDRFPPRSGQAAISRQTMGRCNVVVGGSPLFHFWEVAVGICAPSVIARDFPAVTLPAVMGTLLTLWAVRDAQTDRDVATPSAPTFG